MKVSTFILVTLIVIHHVSAEVATEEERVEIQEALKDVETDMSQGSRGGSTGVAGAKISILETGSSSTSQLSSHEEDHGSSGSSVGENTVRILPAVRYEARQRSSSSSYFISRIKGYQGQPCYQCGYPCNQYCCYAGQYCCIQSGYCYCCV